MRGGDMTCSANITNAKEIWKQFLKKYESDLKKMVTMRCGKMTGEEGGATPRAAVAHCGERRRERRSKKFQFDR